MGKPRISLSQRTRGFINKLDRGERLTYRKLNNDGIRPESSERDTFVMALKLDATAPMFFAHTDEAVCSENGLKRLGFRNIEEDNMNGWDKNGNEYKVTRPGYYFLDLSINVAKNSTMNASITVNNKSYSKLPISAALNLHDEMISRTALLRLSAFDVITIEYEGCIKGYSSSLTIFYIPHQN